MKSFPEQNILHKKYTGAGNELILANLSKLLKSGVPVWVRVPVVPTVNDSEKDIKAIAEFLKTNGLPEKTEFLKYHTMGEHKFRALNREMPKFTEPDDEKMNTIKLFYDKILK